MCVRSVRVLGLCCLRLVVAVLVMVFTSESCLDQCTVPAGRGRNCKHDLHLEPARKELRLDTAVSRLSPVPVDWSALFAWVKTSGALISSFGRKILHSRYLYDLSATSEAVPSLGLLGTSQLTILNTISLI
jgi:hypothetical protein